MSNDWIAMPLDALAFALQLAESNGMPTDGVHVVEPWAGWKLVEDEAIDTLVRDVSSEVLKEYDRLLAA